MFHGKLLYKAVWKIVVQKFSSREPKSKLDGSMREDQGGVGGCTSNPGCQGVWGVYFARLGGWIE